MIPTFQVLGGLLGIFLVTLSVLWARQRMERTPAAPWLDNNGTATVIAVSLTTISAFAGAFLVVGLIGLAIPIWFIVAGTPTAIVLTIYAARFLWRVFHRAPMHRLPPGPAAAAS